MKNPVKSWSYSRYRDYDRCPLFFKLKHIDKVPEPDSPAMARGSAIGKLAEKYVQGQIPAKVPKELSLFARQFQAARALFAKDKPVFTEQMWCFSKNWQPVKSTDWDNAWLRVKMDLCGIDEGANVVVPVDNKTGKYREWDLGTYLEQLEIYGVGGLLRFPVVGGASPRLWFLDAGVEYPQCKGEELYYARKELPLLQKKWEKKIIPLFTDTAFRPKPNSKCVYCPYSNANGGTCKF